MHAIIWVSFFSQMNAILIRIVFFNHCNAWKSPWKSPCHWMPSLIFNKEKIHKTQDNHSTSCIFHVSLKCDQIFGVGLCVVKYDKDSWIVRIVNHWVVQYMGGASSRLVLGNFHAPCSFTVLPSQNATPVNSLVVIKISRTVCVACRVVSI